MVEGFVPDANVEKLAEAYALDAIDFARDHLQSKLDWSEPSVAVVEWILDVFYKLAAKQHPSE